MPSRREWWNLFSRLILVSWVDEMVSPATGVAKVRTFVGIPRWPDSEQGYLHIRARARRSTWSSAQSLDLMQSVDPELQVSMIASRIELLLVSLAAILDDGSSSDSFQTCFE